jgi:hypothetical protein
LLLCSAVVIRLLGGSATVLRFDAEWVYPASVWASWVLPLVICEAAEGCIAAQKPRHPSQERGHPLEDPSHLSV